MCTDTNNHQIQSISQLISVLSGGIKKTIGTARSILITTEEMENASFVLNTTQYGIHGVTKTNKNIIIR